MRPSWRARPVSLSAVCRLAIGRDLRAATVECVVADLPDVVVNGLESLRDVLPVRLMGRVQSGLNPCQPTPSQPNARRKLGSTVKGPPASERWGLWSHLKALGAQWPNVRVA